MRIQCNACCAAEARVLCCADEAALCAACDEEVHAANKLAGKHQRVPLLPPAGGGSSAAVPPVPKCDICQEASGYFFCLEDRALLCRDCDVAIHTVNPYVSAHQRFLLTGVQVGLDPAEPVAPVADKQLNAADGPVDSQAKLLCRSCPSMVISGESSASFPSPKGVIGDCMRTNSFSTARTRLTDWSIGNGAVKPPPKTLSEESPSLPLSSGTNADFSSQISRDGGLPYTLPFSGGTTTDNLPDWPMDELFGATEYNQNFAFAESGSPKADNAKLGSSEGSPQYRLAESLDLDEFLGQVPENMWTVPEVPSPPTASGLHWQGNLHRPGFENSMFVPDVYSFETPQNHFTASVGFKRRRRQF